MNHKQTLEKLTYIVNDRYCNEYTPNEKLEILSWKIEELDGEDEAIRMDCIDVGYKGVANITGAYIEDYWWKEYNLRIEDLSTREWKRHDRDKLVNDMYRRIEEEDKKRG